MTRTKLVFAIFAAAALYLLSASITTTFILFASCYLAMLVGREILQYLETPHQWSCPTCKEKGLTTTFRTNNLVVLDDMIEDHILTFHT